MTLLFCIAAIGLLPSAVSAAPDAPAETWRDFAAGAFEGGTGAKEDPYQIATAKQLAKLAKDMNDGTHYDGDNKKISGMWASH